MRVIKNYLYNVSYQILSIIVPLITSAYIARVLLPKGVGANAFTGSIINYFILFANMGIGYYGNRQIAYVRSDKQKMSQVFWEIQIVKTLLTILSMIAFIIFMHFYTRQSEYMWAQSINLIAVAFDISWFYEGIENFKVTVIKNSFVKILSLIAIFIFIKGPNDVTLYIILLGMSTLLGNFTLWISLRSDLVKVKLRKLNPRIHILPMIELFIPQIAVQIYVQLNKTMLGVMVNEVAAGYYQYSDTLVKTVMAIVTSLATVMLPHMANAIAEGNIKRVNELLYKSFNFINFLGYPCTFGLAAVALTLSPLYYGNGYQPVGQAIMIESIVILMIAWSGSIGVQYLLPLNETKQFTISVTLGAIANIVLNIPFIKIWGLNGAMWATVVSEATVSLYQLWIVRKKISLADLFKENWKYLIASMVMFIFVFYLNQNLSESWLMLLIEVLIGVVIYLIMMLILRASIITQIVFFIKRILKRE